MMNCTAVHSRQEALNHERRPASFSRFSFLKVAQCGLLHSLSSVIWVDSLVERTTVVVALMLTKTCSKCNCIQASNVVMASVTHQSLAATDSYNNHWTVKW